MHYNFAAESFHTKKLCSRLSSRKAQFFLYQKLSLCVFELPFVSLGATYAVLLRLIGKLVVDFLLVIIELCFARCFRFVTIHAFDTQTYRHKHGRTDGRTDGQTDRQTESRQQYRAYMLRVVAR